MLKMLKDEPIAPAAEFYLPDYFQGATRAWGMFETPLGGIKRAFTADILGHWENDSFILDETFLFSDGETDRRTWTLKFAQDRTFVASSSDVVSPGKGHHVTSGCHLSYLMRLRVGKRRIVLRFRDLFYQVDAHTVLNRAKVTKWGIPVGQLFITFKK